MGTNRAGSPEPFGVFDGANVGQNRKHTNAWHAHEETAFRIALDHCMHDFIKCGYLLAQLCHATSIGLTIGIMSGRSASIASTRAEERLTAHPARQQAEYLQYATDIIGQTRCHADELSACSQQRTCTMGIDTTSHEPIVTSRCA